ncbi:DsbA family protein, partial [Patescibacteria group bacterium]
VIIRKWRDPASWRILLIFGWILFVIIAAMTIFFGYKVWFFYTRINKGEVVSLPQYTSRLTFSGEYESVSLPSHVDREVVEQGEHPAVGPEAEEAKLTIVEFGDFECQFSKDTHATIRRLSAKYGDEVRFVYRDYPLESIHLNALSASVAAECAQEQRRFWAYHDKLYLNSPTLSFQNLIEYGNEIGLDTARFEECLIARDTEVAVREDIEVAKRLGIRGTPTFFLNGFRIEGSIPEDEFDNLIQELLVRTP